MLDLKESNLLLLKEIKNFSNQQHELFISLEKTKSLVLIEQTKQQLSLTPIAIKTNTHSSLFLDTFGSNINMTLFAFGVTVTVLGAGFMYYNINSILLNSGFTKLITAFDGCLGVIGSTVTGTIGFFTKKSGLPPANPGSGSSVVSVNPSLDTINPSGNITFSEHTLYHHPIPPILQGGSNSPVVSNSGQQNFLYSSLDLQTFNTLNTEALTPPSLELISEAINTLSQEEVIKPQLILNLGKGLFLLQS